MLKSVPSLKRREINNNVKVNEPFFLWCWDRSMRFPLLRIDEIGGWENTLDGLPDGLPHLHFLGIQQQGSPDGLLSWRRPSSLGPQCGPGHILSRGQAQAAARRAHPRGPHCLRRMCSRTRRAAWLVRAERRRRRRRLRRLGTCC